ncbi:MAG: preprotein translocase subunit SecA [Saprospiraceae bacterium]|nr:preprotein translocase subunit SecA [Saprospiraceae bacterium]MDW8482817.1 preprotein translocase subunit SecA [Saprospiraceae bacterium]
MLGLLKKILGTKQERDMSRYMETVAEINRYFEQYRALSNDELRQKTLEFRQRIADYLSQIDGEINTIHQQALKEENFLEKEALFKQVDELRKERDKLLEEVLMDILPEAFAVVKETCRRFTENEELVVTATEHDRQLAAQRDKTYVRIEGEKAIWKNRWVAAGGDIVWNMVHYDVQLIGGIVLHEGKIAEMATGEGKTLVATLPAYLNGLGGEGVHVVTVNDYLARRDQEWVGPIYEFLLLTVDCIDKYRPHSPERIRAYQCDITYGTNAEFGFDYLRDNMVISVEELVQRKHHYAIVDEVDSVLIDEARTPLIISGPVTRGVEDQEYVELNPAVKRLYEEQVRLANQFLNEARKLFAAGQLGYEEGGAGLPLLRAHRALPKHRPLIKFLSEEGVKVLLQKTEDYYMQENSKRMPEVDRELLFHIDEKNRSVELTDKGLEFLSRFNNDPNFFVLPDIASELVNIDNNPDLSPAEKAAAKERLSQDYGVKSRRIHAVQQLLKAYALFEKDNEYIVTPEGEVKIVDEQTGRIMEGRRYSDGLHQAIEAKENVKVGEITQTYATITLQNYFRMYHKLAGMTGTAETEAKEFWDIYKLDVVVIPTHRKVIREDKDDLVFKTAREKYNAVIEEIIRLRNAGRPVLVGTTSVEISELLSRMLRLRGIEHNVLNAKQHQREAEIVAQAGLAGRVTIATNMAGRGTDIKLGPGVKEAGGLAIIGTERHESRRVDRQLRGRAGRQGDPGSSQFFVSLEDNLMRLFQSERIASLMDRMGHKEGDVIQHPMVTKSIERAQKRVEENNFGIRKRLLEYDDVMNIQREAIYKKRRNALFGDRLSVDINNAFLAITAELVQLHRENGDFETFRLDAIRLIGVDPRIDPLWFKTEREETVIETFQAQVLDLYARKRQQISERLLPLIKRIRAQEGDRYKRVLVPFTDGMLGLNISVDIEEAIRTEGKSIMNDIEKVAMLAIIDEAWKEHLRHIDDLKDSVQGASFEQKDPLVVYKMEAYKLFEALIGQINLQTTSFLLRGTLVLPDEHQAEQARREEARRAQQFAAQRVRLRTNRSVAEEVMTEAQRAAHRAAAEAGQRPATRPQPIVRQPAVGRNDPCPCGSGKKYKHCHGR